MSVFAPNGYFGDHGVMPPQRSWKAPAPCDGHSPDIGTHADLCGRCGWRRHEHQPVADDDRDQESSR